MRQKRINGTIWADEGYLRLCQGIHLKAVVRRPENCILEEQTEGTLVRTNSTEVWRAAGRGIVQIADICIGRKPKRPVIVRWEIVEVHLFNRPTVTQQRVPVCKCACGELIVCVLESNLCKCGNVRNQFGQALLAQSAQKVTG